MTYTIIYIHSSKTTSIHRTPPATPAKRRKRDADEEEAEAHNTDSQVDKCFPFRGAETITFSISQRLYYEFATLPANELYLLPLNWLELWVQHVRPDIAATLECPRWAAFKDMVKKYGMKIHKTELVLSHMIPLQDILKTEQQTPIEQTTPNIQPYLEILKDTNYTNNLVAFTKQDITILDHLKNPQVATILPATTKHYETLINTLGSMETMKAGERKAYTQHWDDKNWFTFQKGTNNSLFPLNFLPEWGGARTWHSPDAGVLRYNPMSQQQHNALMFRMTPVLDVNNKIIPFRCRVMAEKRITLTVRIPPDAEGIIGDVVYEQHLQKLAHETNAKTYRFSHPY